MRRLRARLQPRRRLQVSERERPSCRARHCGGLNRSKFMRSCKIQTMTTRVARRPEEQDMRSDGELAIAGANLVTLKSPAQLFRHRHRGVLNSAQVRLRFVKAESFE